MTDLVEPFDLHVPEEELADLRRRLAMTRWPDRETVPDASQGPQLDKLRALCDYWLDRYDWRRAEDVLNGFGQFRTTVDGLGIHFLHVRSPQAEALPLVMTHGWPGSVLEFRKVIGALTDPVAHGGDPRDAFHLVVPSLPGFGFSDKPTEPGWMFPRIADAWATLMGRLGYERWGAQGGDLGAAVTEQIGRNAPAGCVGLHMNMAVFPPTPEEIAEATPEERAMLAGAQEYLDVLSGYAKQQMTRPQTIGYSLSDSPVGQASWIYGLFQDGCGTRGDAEASFTYDELLDGIMLYWLPNAGPSSARLYWEMVNANAGWQPASPESPITLPTGFTMFPEDHLRKSRRWLERRYGNLIHFNEAERGGHFAALEAPELFVEEVRASFRAIR